MTYRAHTALCLAAGIMTAAAACGMFDGDSYNVQFTTQQQSVNVACAQPYCVSTSPASGTATGRLEMDGLRLTVRDDCSGTGTREGDVVHFSFAQKDGTTSCYSFDAEIHLEGSSLTGTWAEYTNGHGAGTRGVLSGSRR